MLAPWKKSYDELKQHIKNQRHHFSYKGPSSQSYGFSSSHVWMWQLDYKEGCVLKNWCVQIVMLKEPLECPLDCKVIKPVNPKGNQPRVFNGRTDAEAEVPVFWPPNSKSWLIGKDSDAGKGWGQEARGAAEDKIVGWHHRITGHDFEQTPGDGEGAGSGMCCSPWGRKELDTT